MSEKQDYWTRKMVSRRGALRGTAALGTGVAALSLIGCGGSDDDTPASSTSHTSSNVLDSTKGVQGGTFHFQIPSFPPSVDIIGARGGAGFKMAGITHSSLLAYKHGRQNGVDVTSIDSEPDLATALPEQTDQLTYVVKLKQGVKFHSGKVLTSEDVKYTLDRYAFWDRSSFKEQYSWVDRVDAPDANTVIVKSKAPFADAIQRMTMYEDPYIVSKEHQEGPDVTRKQMGTGPYIWSEATSPVSVYFKRNPEYFDKPYPYFDEVRYFVSTDDSKKVADFSSKQIHLTWWMPIEAAMQVRQARPEAQAFAHPASGFRIFMRTDQAPLRDKRIRQALSMTIDRKVIRDAVSRGDGEDDQVFSVINKPWGFRKPRELKSAKNWVLDPAEAKKLMAAAGFDRPLETTWTHYDASVNGQATVDMAVLAQAKWRELGIANIKDNTVTNAIYGQTAETGNYEGMAHGPNQQNIVYGTHMRTQHWSPPEGVKPPTQNRSLTNNPEMSALLDKQLSQFNFEDRKRTFRDIEEIMGEEQYNIIFSTYFQTWFADESVKNVAIPLYFYSGTSYPFKYYWFNKT